jgi:hypothetical protein
MDDSNEIYNALPEQFKHDCSKCQSMCCVALKIEWGDVKKEQDVPCEYLSEEFTCLAWDRLKEVGREDCLGFYCLNTGPAVCGPLFDADTDWKKTPGIAPVLFEEFRNAYVALCKSVFGFDPAYRDEDQEK